MSNIEEKTIKKFYDVMNLVFPNDSDPSVLPLYVEEGGVQAGGTVTVRIDNSGLGSNGTISESEQAHLDMEAQTPKKVFRAYHFFDQVDRHSAVIKANRAVSFSTFMNIFPASLWKEHTIAKSVRLVLELEGECAVDIFRSTARGTWNRIAGDYDAGVGEKTTVKYDLPLDSFGDGGFLWFEIATKTESVKINRGVWQVLVEEKANQIDSKRTKASIAITTFNNPEECVKQMNRFISAPETLERIDKVMITDQGNKLVEDADGFKEASENLGKQFKYIKQPNLGGSGGFSRGMYEGIRNPDSDYVMLLDDDAIIEPESILRSINFAEFCRRPTIVGGHMLNLYERSTVHNFGERIDKWDWMWGPVTPPPEGLDFAKYSYKQIPSLHRRIDPEMTGWWMCLIPREIIQKIGLSLPVFIKWDDCEYGVRAGENGYRIVHLTGAAVWHMPWTEKDDRLDWQAFYHQRNKLLAAMLHSPFKKGGHSIQHSFLADVKHLFCYQYGAVELRHQGIRDLLSGPEHLHKTIFERNQTIRKTLKTFHDGQIIKNVEDFPAVINTQKPRKKPVEYPKGKISLAVRLAKTGLKNLLKRSPYQAGQNPQVRLPSVDAQWFKLGPVDSALVSVADGKGAMFYVRSRKIFVHQLMESISLHRKLKHNWNKLQVQYKEQLSRVVSEIEWSNTFGVNEAKMVEEREIKGEF
ncbi:MAG: glycosyltransferase [Candidatus Ancillula sp.]|jgi:galactofuranosylgalactofuranosylrhamnosyl-N-acetylglucosaminyl-diphospho-decaprenol beta-1,5/1,6-galactofuranosyltransferase|nr:glycosyltransferase [Candidatus Ancillula sp.]